MGSTGDKSRSAEEKYERRKKQNKEAQKAFRARKKEALKQKQREDQLEVEKLLTATTDQSSKDLQDGDCRLIGSRPMSEPLAFMPEPKPIDPFSDPYEFLGTTETSHSDFPPIESLPPTNGSYLTEMVSKHAELKKSINANQLLESQIMWQKQINCELQLQLAERRSSV